MSCPTKKLLASRQVDSFVRKAYEATERLKKDGWTKEDYVQAVPFIIEASTLH